MIYRLATKGDPPYNDFTVPYEYWKQSDSLFDVKTYLELINSDNPYRKTPFKDNWTPMKVNLYSKAKSRKVKDISNIHMARSPVFSEKARDVLGEFLNENGEFLEIECIDDGKTYYLYNVLTYVDIIDEEKSTYFYYKKDVDFDKLSIFKIISNKFYLSCSDSIFYTQKFLDKVIKYKLKGLYIYPEPFIEESVENKKAVEEFSKFTTAENLALLGNRW